MATDPFIPEDYIQLCRKHISKYEKTPITDQELIYVYKGGLHWYTLYDNDQFLITKSKGRFRTHVKKFNNMLWYNVYPTLEDNKIYVTLSHKCIGHNNEL